MSKIYEQYLKLKEKDSHQMYLFRCGNFYIFVGEDAIQISEKVVLKLTPFCKDIMKCGFPVSSLNDYMRVFANLHIDVKVIEKEIVSLEEKQKKIWKMLQRLDLENITPLGAFQELVKMREIIDE